ncbi:MAG: hypothetical protein RLZZ403_429 [Pseudomonadota bacterium]|jgi:phage gpG-like protein
MKNITVTLDEKVAAWARAHAARHDKSLSRFIGDLLQQTMHEARVYEAAMQDFLSRKPRRINRDGAALPSREALHDRASLR